jgi:hypothetical protein
MFWKHPEFRRGPSEASKKAAGASQNILQRERKLTDKRESQNQIFSKWSSYLLEC